MKSSDDELNDAIKNALQGSFRNFERKPKASLDEQIYRELGRRPSRKPLWAASGVAALIAVMFLWYVKADKDRVVVGVIKPVTENRAHKALPDLHKGERNGSENQGDIAAKVPVKVNDDHPILSTPQVTAARKEGDQPENQPLLNPFRSSISKQNAKSETLLTYPADDSAATGKIDDLADVTHFSELDLHSALRFPVLGLPMITLPMLEITPDSVSQEVVVDKRVSSWKPAMLVNVSATNTSQSVYLLPSAHSRILKVSFPNSIANIGYKIGFGMQAKGYQLLVNYSHLQYQTEYVYALDEFTAEPANANYNFRRLGMARTVRSAFDIVGIAAKKNFDFETKLLGALYAQLGMEYSRTVMGPDQRLVAASLSAGKRIFASPKATIIIGPFFEYNILRILTTEENVKIRPNQVGISLGLKFAN
ncbi:hypothetical protein LXM25_09970 [Dyadobacter sp. LJ53]|uniref:hypothetical protein n=1 Tax=Dyadobacter chenwenxiniae TaxID=2906456 RepID=UPI001F3AC991|nr:hypothetical protein [Dyadobacter chenwenxiniae]MCF0050384.1 hypothetical protein [Dyadobacter chenwenxiniae]